ncbi:MAG: hypothetical protein IT380_17430 [Myxococcales bacterium]|nr:hypothetical protein [Myxococcales bacterium]
MTLAARGVALGVSLSLLLWGCGGQVSEALVPTPFDSTLTESTLALSAAPSFADERGGGIFVDLAGRVVRMRANGSQGVIEAHPQNPVLPGPAEAVWALGPYSALVSTSRGVFVADTGWLISPPWQATLPAAGFKGSTVGENGVGWLAHEQGLYRLEGGLLTELKVEGASVAGLTALAVGPAPDGVQGLWFAQGESLTSASPTSRTAWTVRDSGLSAKDLAGGVKAMAGITASKDSPGEVWAITPHALFQFTVLGWRRYELGRSPRQIMSSGRVAWLQAGDGLFRYDADAQRWTEAKGLPAVPTLVAVDAAGVAWVRVGEKTYSVSPGPAARLVGLFENMRVYEPELPVTGLVPATPAPTALSWRFDDGQAHDVPVMNAAAGTGPTAGLLSFALGGQQSATEQKPVSFATLEDGRHTLELTVTYGEGAAATTSARRLHFEFLGSASAVLSFERDIRPLSDGRCAKCHAAGTQPELRTYEQWVANAPAIATAVRDRRMPADGPLDPAGILAIQRWVNGGAQP